MKKPTIKDVAKKAGVSIATVSRVINKASNVNDVMRQRVIKAIDELNYTPNRIARGLKKKNTNTIGVIVPNISNPFFMNIVKNIENIIQEHGYTIIIGSTEDRGKKELNYIQLFSEKQVDGIIVASTGKNEKELDKLNNSGLPIIFIDRRPANKNFSAIYVNKKQATNKLVEYLISKGHKRIALVTGPKEIMTNFDRYVGFLEAFYNHDLEPNHDHIKFKEFTSSFGKRALKSLWELEESPTAIISGSSLITKGILIEANLLNIHIPDDLSLVSYGNIDMSELIKPKITYAREMADEIGRKTGEVLLESLDLQDKTLEELSIKTEIIKQNSVKSL